MKKNLSILFLFFFSLALTSLYAQKKDEVSISGTVYMNASRSQGVLNGKTFYDPQYTFRNQTIYFKGDSTSLKTKTDSLGVYSILLKPGTYEVFQEEGLKNTNIGMVHYGTSVIVVTKAGGPYDVFFKNHVNGRSAAPGAMPGGKPTHSKPVKIQKQP